MPVNIEPDYTIAQTEAELQVSKPTVYKLIKRGLLESYLIGRCRRVKRASIKKLKQEAA